MINLNTYLKRCNWDGHIHLFNSSQYLFNLYNVPFSKFVGFVDVEFDRVDEFDKHMVDMYENYINNMWNENQILLATAPTAEEAIDVYKKFPNVIKGFGELKLYDTYKGKEVPYKKISTARKICEFSSKNGNLPVYIHYSLTNDKEVKLMDNLLKSYPNTPIVLCHCGMEEGSEEFAYHHCIDFMKKYSNLWCDISYTSRDFFIVNPMTLYNLDLNRLILGSDINLKIFGPGHDNSIGECENIIRCTKKLSEYINSDFNLKKLFKL